MRFFVYALAVALPSFADGLSKGDRDITLSHLHGTRKLTLDAVAGLTPAQWNFKPAPDRWSIAETLEHIILTERQMFGETRNLLKKPPATTAPSEKATDEAVLNKAGTRVAGVKAPPSLEPKGTLGSGERLVAEYRQTRDAVLEFVRTTDLDLRRYFGDAPKPMDAVQWILYFSAHNERHLDQIAEIKASAGYPK